MAYVYSCCFWFSLRLGGILIGIFSMLQSALVLTALCEGLDDAAAQRQRLSAWMQRTTLSFAKSTFETILSDLEGFMTVGIALTSIYLLLCTAFVYGAYKCKIVLMLGYLVTELMRLVAEAALLVAGLMLLKENTMDIGQLIGASIAGGFSMLGMFYLWVCAVSLPVLIKEMEREQHLETIEHLQRLLAQRGGRRNYADIDDLLPLPTLPASSAADSVTPVDAGRPVHFVNTISSDFPPRIGYGMTTRPFLR